MIRHLAVTAVSALWLLASPAQALQATSEILVVEAATFETEIASARANMMGDPNAALAHINRAEAILAARPDPGDVDSELATVLWLKSEALTRLGRPVEARPIAQQALAELGADPAPTKLFADILVSLGRIYKVVSEYGLALENFQSAYEVYLEIGDTRSESIVLQSIGSIYNDAHQYRRAESYYLDAMNRHPGDPALDLAANNNLGNAYRELGEYYEALDRFQRAYAIAAEMDSDTLQARILNNIASLQIVFGELDAAATTIDNAFAIIGDVDGSEWTRFLWGTRAQISLGRGDLPSARNEIDRTFDGVSIAGTTHSFTEFHAAAADIFQTLNDADAALPHLRAFKRLDDEARDVAASANTSLLAAQFDFAQQNLRIEQLRLEGSQQDLRLANAHARQRLIAVSALLVLSIAILMLIFMRQRASRERQLVLETALYQDVETALPSRPAAERAIAELAASTGGPVTLIALGIERFKHLKIALGFTRSAQLKIAMAERIRANLGAEMVAALGPDMLGIIIAVPDASAVLPAADRIRVCFNSPITLDGVDIDVAVTAGLYAGTVGEECVMKAVIAIDQARAMSSAAAVFDAEQFGDPDQNLTLMSRMIRATRNGDMAMQYQPKLHLASGTYLAAEALCRWTDPEQGVIFPDHFIPLAEETGHIREFTLWSIEQVVRDQQALWKAGHEISLAVNISGSLISDPDFAELALHIATQGPERISFEVTETAAMQNPERALANLEKWAAAGIRLAIDDYGSGLSSLAYLKTLPSHELKLDRAFVTHMASSQRDRMLVKSTSDLAHGLGLEMTAEGVETLESLALLKLMGCDWAQGWALAKAMPLNSLIEFLETHAQTAIPDTATGAEQNTSQQPR
ncbi:EAL domain-containing protein [Maricaulis salignorans]|uniref:EAL domain-containing protein n=1 Tax=Maricaulis salignorans TaxID=144026 RepID=UPI003A93F9E0